MSAKPPVTYFRSDGSVRPREECEQIKKWAKHRGVTWRPILARPQWADRVLGEIRAGRIATAPVITCACCGKRARARIMEGFTLYCRRCQLALNKKHGKQ